MQRRLNDGHIYKFRSKILTWPKVPTLLLWENFGLGKNNRNKEVGQKELTQEENKKSTKAWYFEWVSSNCWWWTDDVEWKYFKYQFLRLNWVLVATYRTNGRQ